MRLLTMLVIALMAAAGVYAGETGPAGLLPADGEIEGWKKDGEPLIYGPDNLWEYINGQAEVFIPYDFREVAAQHYLDPEELEVKVEAYWHGSALNAFGIYTQLRSPDVEFLDIGNEAFGDGYSIHFWKGGYYVKVSAYDEGEKSSAAMKEFASLVAGKIADGGEQPPEVSLFPPGGLVEKSVTYVTGGVMGSSKLPAAFTAEYVEGETKGMLYLFPLETEENAGETFDWYSGEIGAKAGKASAGNTEFKVADGEAPYRGPVRIFRYGRFMGIVTGFEAGSKTASGIAAGSVKLIDGSCGGK